jgi:phthiodiolone/phenolphthiodiolone dimycocerosates ketoreductase
VKAVPPQLIGYGLLWGTPEQVAGKLRAFGEVGVRHVGFLPLQMLISRRAALYGLWAIGRIARKVRNARSG